MLSLSNVVWCVSIVLGQRLRSVRVNERQRKIAAEKKDVSPRTLTSTSICIISCEQAWSGQIVHVPDMWVCWCHV
jgi:hypothetical protein